MRVSMKGRMRKRILDLDLISSLRFQICHMHDRFSSSSSSSLVSFDEV